MAYHQTYDLQALTQGLQQVLASTILTALMGALTLPIVLTKLAYLIDNPWTVSLDRADAAGLILADSLMDRNLGVRPITLVGFSLGSRVIFSCLRELAKRGAYGLVQNVYLFGAPVVAEKEQWLRARTVISGRFVNGYASNDWILGVWIFSYSLSSMLTYSRLLVPRYEWWHLPCRRARCRRYPWFREHKLHKVGQWPYGV